MRKNRDIKTFEENAPKYLKVHAKYVTSMPANKESLLSEESKNNLMKLAQKYIKY